MCSSSWDEHVFELVLPKACMVGHVDFKFVLNANIANIPQIQVTLLKNKAPGLGKVTGELTPSASLKMRSEVRGISLSLHNNAQRSDCCPPHCCACTSRAGSLRVKCCRCAHFDCSPSSLCLDAPRPEQRRQSTGKSPSLFPMPCTSMGKRMGSRCCTTSLKTSSSWI